MTPLRGGIKRCVCWQHVELLVDLTGFKTDKLLLHQ